MSNQYVVRGIDFTGEYFRKEFDNAHEAMLVYTAKKISADVIELTAGGKIVEAYTDPDLESPPSLP